MNIINFVLGNTQQVFYILEDIESMIGMCIRTKIVNPVQKIHIRRF